MSLPTLWTHHLPEEKREDFASLVRNSRQSLSRLHDIVDEWDTAVTSVELKEVQFESPNWAYKQAYRNGQRSAYRRVLALLAFLDQGTEHVR